MIEPFPNSPEPVLSISEGIKERIFPGRRRGRPKCGWANQALKEVWEELRWEEEDWRFRAFDEDSDLKFFQYLVTL